MNGARSRTLRRLAALALLPLFGLVFWTAATVASSLPGLLVVGVNVHGLGLASYASGPKERPAPLSIRALEDAQGDASGIRTSSPPATPPAPPAAPSRAPTPTPAPATIWGQVLDSQTLLPIPAAAVSLSPGGKSAPTDANGYFSIGVIPGSYTVTASAPTYNSASYGITIAAGQKATIAFRLVSVAAYGSLSGKVIDGQTRAPIAGATVTLSDGMVRVTDLSGNFAYAIVLNGTYTLTVAASGYVTQSKSVTITPGHTTSVLFDLARVSQQNGGV
jgi:hypothetical protein